jgi:GT2 family glycosyltransferase/gamma-glutamylcyclotransferase (GGCT)/AIG2-like uncharacterized protein YtfP
MPRDTVLSIVIPVRNGFELTRDCLTSLRETTPGGFYEVVVVDNGSTDATAAELEPLGRSLFGERFVARQLHENVDFGPACNLGADLASGSLLFFLNNDTLLHKGWHAPLMAALKADDRLGAVGPLLTYPDDEWNRGRVQHAGIGFDLSMAPTHLYELFPADHPAVAQERQVQALSAAAIMTPAMDFRQQGGFHPGYRNGYEDMDLCCRLRRAGRRMRLIPASRITHLTSQTPGRYDHEDANARLFAERCAGCFDIDMHKIARRDGYETKLNEWLLSVVCLPEERQEELARDTALTTDPAELEAMLLREPLWEGGYAKWALLLEESGDLWEAARAKYLHSFFFPSLETFAALGQTASAAGLETLAAQADLRLAHARERLAEGDRLRTRAEAMADWARDSDREPLEAIYRAWLLETELPDTRQGSHLVFVYGTLRKGLHNHPFLRSARFVGHGVTREPYALYADSLPYLVNEPVCAVRGEVYEVDDAIFAALDALEDHPHMYRREPTPIVLDNGDEPVAWAYFYPSQRGALVPGGDYCKHLKES